MSEPVPHRGEIEVERAGAKPTLEHGHVPLLQADRRPDRANGNARREHRQDDRRIRHRAHENHLRDSRGDQIAYPRRAHVRDRLHGALLARGDRREQHLVARAKERIREHGLDPFRQRGGRKPRNRQSAHRGSRDARGKDRRGLGGSHPLHQEAAHERLHEERRQGDHGIEHREETEKVSLLDERRRGAGLQHQIQESLADRDQDDQRNEAAQIGGCGERLQAGAHGLLRVFGARNGRGRHRDGALAQAFDRGRGNEMEARKNG